MKNMNMKEIERERDSPKEYKNCDICERQTVQQFVSKQSYFSDTDVSRAAGVQIARSGIAKDHNSECNKFSKN